MNDEELKQLKKGDEVFVKVFFDRLAADGDAYVNFSWTNRRGKRIVSHIAVTFDSVFLRSDLQPPAPKYDPCRPFKKGDKVEYSPRDGRDFFDVPWIYDAASVIEDEDRAGMVGVRFTFNYGGPSVHKVPWYYLKLVTPVEELEPFFVYEDATSWQVKKGKSLCARYGKATHPHAKEAAEDEAKRLNADYRKEQE